MLTQTQSNPRVAVYMRVATYEQLGEPITALYCRTATPCDMGIETQKDLLMRYAEKNGYRYCVTFVDDGESGMDVNRPAFQDMFRGIESGYIKRVLTSDLSRLSRNHFLTQELLILFDKYDVELVSVKDGYNSSVNDEGNLLVNLSSVLSKLYAGHKR